MKNKLFESQSMKATGMALVMLLAFYSNVYPLNIGGGANINIGSGITFNTSGGIKFESTGAMDNSGTVTLTGDWTNNGSGLINGSAGTVVFNGTGSQTIGGSSATTFNNLTVNNGSGVNNNVSLAVNVTVSGTLTFTNGNIVTGSSKVIMPSTGTISGAGTTTGWVNGNLDRGFATGSNSFKYEMGDASVYAPATLDMNNVSGAVNITGYVASANANENVPTTNASNIDQAKKSNLYWFMNKSGAGTYTSYDITLDFTNTTNTGSPANYIVRKFEPSSWSSTTSTVTGTTIKAIGLLSFGDFEVGENGIITFNAKLFIQGYYLGSGKMSPLLHLLNTAGSGSTDVDTITVELHNRLSPYDTVYTAKGILKSDGSLACYFPGTANAGKYYIAVKHRNALETWSADSASITSTYDFTTAQNKAYGNNLVNLDGTNYGIFSGDVTNGSTLGVHDGHIDAADKKQIQNALSSFKIGLYDVLDITGDGFVDEDDYRIILNNAPAGIILIRP